MPVSFVRVTTTAKIQPTAAAASQLEGGMPVEEVANVCLPGLEPVPSDETLGCVAESIDDHPPYGLIGKPCLKEKAVVWCCVIEGPEKGWCRPREAFLPHILDMAVDDPIDIPGRAGDSKLRASALSVTESVSPGMSEVLAEPLFVESQVETNRAPAGTMPFPKAEFGQQAVVVGGSYERRR
jgi:hypothetical protein